MKRMWTKKSIGDTAVDSVSEAIESGALVLPISMYTLKLSGEGATAFNTFVSSYYPNSLQEGGSVDLSTYIVSPIDPAKYDFIKIQTTTYSIILYRAKYDMIENATYVAHVDSGNDDPFFARLWTDDNGTSWQLEAFAVAVA